LARTSFRVLLAALAALLLWPALAFAETPAEYRDALAETVRASEDAVSALPAASPLADYPPLGLALTRLGSVVEVTTGPGSGVTVDNRALIRRLRGARGEASQAQESLRRLLTAVESSAGQADWAGSEEARNSLEDVLARPEFQKASPNPIGQFLEDLRTRIFQWFAGVLPDFGLPQIPGLDLGKAGSVIFWLLAVGFAVFTIVFFAFTWRSSRRTMAQYAALDAGVIKDTEDARAARAAAQKAANEGDYRRAVHYLYLWAILHLAEESQLRYDRSLTNREQLRALRTAGETTDLLKGAVDTFDRIWYGHASCTVAEYGQFRNTVERIVGTAA